LATTLVLAFFDAGTLVGAPIAGAILSYSARLSLSPFPTMFVAVAAIISISAGIYAFAGRVDKADETAASDESGFPDKAASKQEWRESPQPRI